MRYQIVHAGKKLGNYLLIPIITPIVTLISWYLFVYEGKLGHKGTVIFYGYDISLVVIIAMFALLIFSTIWLLKIFYFNNDYYYSNDTVYISKNKIDIEIEKYIFRYNLNKVYFKYSSFARTNIT